MISNLSDRRFWRTGRSWSDVRSPWQRVLVAISLFVLATAAASVSQALGKPVTAALIYILGVTVIGALQGSTIGLASAFLASVIYNFAISDPLFSFRFSDADDFVPLIAFNVCAFASGALAGQLKYNAQHAQANARELRALLEVSNALQAVLSPKDIATKIHEFESDGHGLMALLFVLQNGNMTLMSNVPLGDSEFELARIAEIVGKGTFVGTAHGWEGRALTSSEGVIGSVLIRSADQQSDPSASFVDAFANLVGLTLERCFLLDRVAANSAIERSEAFKTTLLSSISHDMRTPLATISASASGLITYGDQLPSETKEQLLEAIQTQCRRLDRYTANLLNLSRLQSGLEVTRLSLIDVAEVLGSAINNTRPLIGARLIDKSLGSEAVLVRADAILLEQVFLNILDNAVAYSRENSTIRVTLQLQETQVRVMIADQGVGIPSSELKRIFERFYRIERLGLSVRGSGLGLAIAKGFVEMVGGEIWAESPAADGLGTAMIVNLPLAEVA